MPWFAVGDSTYDHPKALAAGNAAIGLWLRCGAYASAHLTDGVIPGAVASKSGTGTQVRKLLDAGLWHAARHNCPRCPQVREGDYVMHDYLDANPSRQQVQERRRRAAEKKRQQRGGGRSSLDEDDSPHDRGPDRDAARGNGAGQRPESPGDGGGPRARPAPSSPSRREGAGVGARSEGGWGRRAGTRCRTASRRMRPPCCGPLPRVTPIASAARRGWRPRRPCSRTGTAAGLRRARTGRRCGASGSGSSGRSRGATGGRTSTSWPFGAASRGCRCCSGVGGTAVR